MTLYQLYLTDDAARDIEDLHAHIALHGSPENADYVLTKIENAFTKLSEFPARGPYPKELVALGIREYREIFFKPYRIIYKIVDQDVYVMLIVDGRRDMETLLLRRLLES